ncbi:MAG TPA: RibD family protein, partial [Desulfobulbaceae bacterium]|nr:RibD family protein [Desulfobulbaceae bacterium]
VRIDNPSLTTRLNDQDSRDPLRVIIDSRLRIDPEAKIFEQQSNAGTWIFCTSRAPEEKQDILCQAGAVIYRVSATEKGRVDLTNVLQILGENNITSLLVEGGAAIHGSFLSQGLVDEVYLFLAPFFIGDTGLPLLKGYSTVMPDLTVRLKDVTVQQFGEDSLIHGIFS